jgi:hypothetical protein
MRGSCKNRRFGGTYVVPSSPTLVALMKEALSSPKRRFLQEPYGITSQKSASFIVTTVKTSNLTREVMISIWSSYIRRTNSVVVGEITLLDWITDYRADYQCNNRLLEMTIGVKFQMSSL